MAMRSFKECQQVLNSNRNLYNFLACKTKAWLELMDTTAAWSSMPQGSRVRYWQQMSMCCTVRMFLPLHALGLSSKQQLKQLADMDGALSMLMAMQSQYQEDVVYPDTDAPPVTDLSSSSSSSSTQEPLCSILEEEEEEAAAAEEEEVHPPPPPPPPPHTSYAYSTVSPIYARPPANRGVYYSYYYPRTG
ncbi:hypothetical protein OEZ85_010981 [Tetradesmus obliquus]|uniref:Uncharacterized protein n=1 Tax=Tetradesmus obliquus TaxID=3088 RepID=A0ABY8TNX2_TETOB|nr:hypothetical protein OEZ85_010981 [Tetradesmus obliquus]